MSSRQLDCPDPSLQSGAVLTVALTALRQGFNVAFPGRDTTSDGWIGDAAHQERTSGHNPDDTAGVSAEYSDADSKEEVRAIDVDKDFRSAAATMGEVIARILATPADTKRLKYIIYDRTEWAKSTGWTAEPYDGDNPHTEIGHFSGDPDYDEDGSPWSVATMGADMTDGQSWVLHVMNYRLDAILHMREQCVVPDYNAPGGTKYQGYTENCQINDAIRAQAADLKRLADALETLAASGGGGASGDGAHTHVPAPLATS